MSRKSFIVMPYLLVTMCMTAGCADWLTDVPTIEPLPSLTPSPIASPTPAVSDLQASATAAFSPTPIPTASPIPRYSPTPPIGATSTPSNNLLTVTALGPVSSISPRIIYFVATPTEVLPGEPVLLFWSSERGSAAAVYRVNEDGTPGRTWAVDTEGSLTVTPRTVGGTEIYTLSVTNGTVTVERSVSITVACLFTWFFLPAPAGSCPESQANVSPATAQLFERGRMFWLAVTDEIIVLFNVPEGQGSGNNPAWLIVPDPYLEGQPEDDPAIIPPEGFRQPRRGFGTLWRTTPAIRDRLGWAVNDEVPYTVTYQRGQSGGETITYFTDETGAVIGLLPQGQGWEIAGP